mmetsp:Transcript_23412/g.57588  ORF Transcript_23412/g.57588 Transcript_23412/m.57588 type:complete len:96 (-) Transcript_23412:375-662(-)
MFIHGLLHLDIGVVTDVVGKAFIMEVRGKELEKTELCLDVFWIHGDRTCGKESKLDRGNTGTLDALHVPFEEIVVGVAGSVETSEEVGEGPMEMA